MTNMEHALIDLLGLDPADAKQRAEDLATRLDLTVITPRGESRHELQGTDYLGALDRLRGRYTGDNRLPGWHQTPHLINASFPGLLAALLSDPTPAAVAYVVAAAIHLGRDIPRSRFNGATVIWDGFRFAVFCRARGGH